MIPQCSTHPELMSSGPALHAGMKAMHRQKQQGSRHPPWIACWAMPSSCCRLCSAVEVQLSWLPSLRLSSEAPALRAVSSRLSAHAYGGSH